MTTTMNLLHYSDPYTLQSVIFLVLAFIAAIGFFITGFHLKATFSIISIILVLTFAVASITFSDKSKDANIEQLQDWMKDNYSLTLTHQDAATLYKKGSLIAERKNSVEKIELERYKGGYLLFNDGKAIKQENK